MPILTVQNPIKRLNSAAGATHLQNLTSYSASLIRRKRDPDKRADG